MADITTSIALITKYSTEGFDKTYKANATCSVLAKSNELVQFTGTKTVKVAKMAFGGLSNYYRNNIGDDRIPTTSGQVGYQGSLAGLTWEEHQLKMDRAAKYVIEHFDNEESGDLIIGKALTEINRTQIVPEVDAYCWSKVYQLAGVKTEAKKYVGKTGHEIIDEADYNALTATEKKGYVVAPLAMLNDGLYHLESNEVTEDNVIFVMSTAYRHALRNTIELTKFVTQDQLGEGKDIKFTIGKYEGKDFVVVPPARFKTAYDFLDSDNGGGFKPAADAKDIDFICMSKNAATHVTKFEKTRILSGDVATAMSNMDGYVLLARIYHDVFVFDNHRIAIYAHTGAFTNEAYIADTLKVFKTAKNKVARIIFTPGDKFITPVVYTGSGTPAVNDAVNNTEYTVLRVGDAITAETKVYAVNTAGKICAICNAPELEPEAMVKAD